MTNVVIGGQYSGGAANLWGGSLMTLLALIEVAVNERLQITLEIVNSYLSPDLPVNFTLKATITVSDKS